jgi:act minimal PKS acyl carrier protein
MNELTVPQLLEILKECAGDWEPVPMTDDVAEMELVALGYDSLAVLEAASRVERRFGIGLPEEEVYQAHTPGALVELVNSRLTAGAERR